MLNGGIILQNLLKIRKIISTLPPEDLKKSVAILMEIEKSGHTNEGLRKIFLELDWKYPGEILK